MFYPLVLNISQKDFAPKITGMLIDMDVTSIKEILPLLENEALLK